MPPQTIGRLPDDEYAELSQDLPTLGEPFLQKYLQGREGLIAQEKKLRSGECLLQDSQTTLTSVQTMHFVKDCPRWPKKLVASWIEFETKNRSRYGLRTSRTIWPETSGATYIRV